MSPIETRVSLDHGKVAAFCQGHGIKRLAFFGSVLRDDFGPDSDVDLLVEFKPGASVGLFEMAGMEIELGTLLGRKADLRTPAELSRHFRDRILADAVDEYVGA